jgi:hypothetical protein
MLFAVRRGHPWMICDETLPAYPWETAPKSLKRRVGDVILQVDLKPVGKTVYEVSEMLKGKSGSMVSIQVAIPHHSARRSGEESTARDSQRGDAFSTMHTIRQSPNARPVDDDDSEAWIFFLV